MKTSRQISPTHSLYVTKQNFYNKTFKHLKYFFTRLKFHLKFATMANISLWHTWNLKLSSTHFFKLQHWNFQQLKELSSAYLKLKKLKNIFSHLKTYNTFEEISSTPPTHLEMLQIPCMSPLGNGLTLILQIKTFFSKRFSLFVRNTSSKPFTTSCFNTMSFLLLSMNP